MSEPLRGIVVSVHYDDFLAHTLPLNMRHLSECLVVTAPADQRTKAVARSIPGVQVYETDAFYRHGADFCKGLAMEEGFDVLGRFGWILVWDADIVFPDAMPLKPELGNLYTPRRRIVPNVRDFLGGQLKWEDYPASMEREHAGYFQLFHAKDRALRERPWYGVNWKHAGGCDSVFQRKWDRSRKHRPDWTVLHLGPVHTNWHGRVSARIDQPPAQSELSKEPSE